MSKKLKAMKSIAAAIALGCLLSSCASQKSPPPPATMTDTPSPIPVGLSVPRDCQNTPIFASLQRQLFDATFIDTSWDPAVGTDLEAILSHGGLACSYGIQSAEIGITSMWVEDPSDFFTSRVKTWLKDGYVKVEIPNLPDISAYFLYKAQSATQEFHVWQVEMQYKGYWVRLSSSFGDSLKANLPLLIAAIDSLSPTPPKENVVGCYIGTLANDRYILNITSHVGTSIKAKVAFLNSQKDQSKGELVGSFYGGLLNGIYTFASEGTISRAELFFKKDGLGFRAGYGPIETTGDLSKFVRPLSLSWEMKYSFLPGKDCSFT
jgi:hypothetical protein